MASMRFMFVTDYCLLFACPLYGFNVSKTIHLLFKWPLVYKTYSNIVKYFFRLCSFIRQSSDSCSASSSILRHGLHCFSITHKHSVCVIELFNSVYSHVFMPDTFLRKRLGDPFFFSLYSLTFTKFKYFKCRDLIHHISCYDEGFLMTVFGWINLVHFSD